jgi:hypothetical protein
MARTPVFNLSVDPDKLARWKKASLHTTGGNVSKWMREILDEAANRQIGEDIQRYADERLAQMEAERG